MKESTVHFIVAIVSAVICGYFIDSYIQGAPWYHLPLAIWNFNCCLVSIVFGILHSGDN